MLKLFIFVAVVGYVGAISSVLGGIPVPGRRVPILRLFENYAASCRPIRKRDFRMDQLAEIMQSLNAEEVAQKLYNAIFFAMVDIQIERIMGKWYRVVDSKNIHKDDCAVFYFESLGKNEFTSTFTSTQYVLKNDDVVSYVGFGRMMGPDPGEVLISTGHPEDPCPFFPVMVGGVNSQGQYEFMILSTPVKYPTMVLTRDQNVYNKKYKGQVQQLLEKHGFVSPVAALNTRLHFVNTTMCARKSSYYDRPF
ncbi:unnamed protein product [Auanema sp. JU1783]|nr:unnamed protein product [Auanema sp. JU1783]